MIKADLESALALWDALEEEAEIYVPVVLDSTSNGKFFVERGTLPANKDRMLVRVFVNRDEADSYKLFKKGNRLTLATTTVGHLLASLERNLTTIDGKIECVLSTLDMNGNFHILETLWSNTNRNS